MSNSGSGVWKVVVGKGGCFRWPVIAEQVFRPKLGDRFGFSCEKKSVVVMRKMETALGHNVETVEETPDGPVLRLPRLIRERLRLKEGDVLTFSVERSPHANDVNVRFWKE
jgi:hypothetical protein